MPTFCRHNRLIQHCPICSREQALEMRPVVTGGAAGVRAPRPTGDVGHGERSGDRAPGPTRKRAGGPAGRGRGRGGAVSAGSGVRVRRLERGADDGYRSELVPGLRSSAEAERLAEELAFAATRLASLEREPPGLYAEVATGSGDLEERAWLAFQIVYLGPLEAADGEPFEAITQARTSWESGQPPALERLGDRVASAGPRAIVGRTGGDSTPEAYRAWARRSGSQTSAFTGDASWAPERRFDRVYERLALPGMHRDARYELLVSLGRLGVCELRGGRLHLGGENVVTVAAKRAFGIGDPMLLDRRAGQLAEAAEVPLEALDLALFNWERGERARAGVPVGVEPQAELSERCRGALGVE